MYSKRLAAAAAAVALILISVSVLGCAPSSTEQPTDPIAAAGGKTTTPGKTGGSAPAAGGGGGGGGKKSGGSGGGATGGTDWAGVIRAKCVACHNVGTITAAEMDRDSWIGVVTGMQKKGAPISQDEIMGIVNFMVDGHPGL